MARIPSKEEIEYMRSTDPAKYDVSDYENTHYRYNFPYGVGVNTEKGYDVYGLRVCEGGAPFLTVHSARLLTTKDAYFKLSVSLALLSLFEKEGFSPRPIAGIGGYNNGVTDEVYEEVKHSELVQGYINSFNTASSPFQIQSRFTLSRAYSMMQDPESAIIEFFKIIELFIKENAQQGRLSEAACADVFAKFPKTFSNNVKDSLKNGILKPETVDAIWKLKNIRNRFVGHGGIRPMVAEAFGDPEENAKAINYAEFTYDIPSDFGEHFFEKIMYDIEALAVILFCKLNGVEPIYVSVPGCWWQPSGTITEIMGAEKVSIIQLYPSELEPPEET